METVSMCASQRFSVYNIYIHGQAFKQKKLICKRLKGRLSIADKTSLNFEHLNF